MRFLRGGAGGGFFQGGACVFFLVRGAGWLCKHSDAAWGKHRWGVFRLLAGCVGWFAHGGSEGDGWFSGVAFDDCRLNVWACGRHGVLHGLCACDGCVAWALWFGVRFCGRALVGGPLRRCLVLPLATAQCAELLLCHICCHFSRGTLVSLHACAACESRLVNAGFTQGGLRGESADILHIVYGLSYSILQSVA